MKPPAFEYVAAESEEHALELKARYGDDARFLAGGQSLVPAMNYRLVQPAVLIDLNRVESLAGIGKSKDGKTRIGAMTRHRSVERDAVLAWEQPLLGAAMRNVAHPQVRNRGTLGGNLAHADPASEMPAALLALDAQVLARSSKGERQIRLDQFFKGVYSTALTEAEMLVEIVVPPLPSNARTCFMEIARRRGDFAMMGVAVVVKTDDACICRFARIALCNAGPGPVLARKSADMLMGHSPSDDALKAAADAAAQEIDPPGSLQASPDYQRHLARVVTYRALRAALA
ncbi:MAG: FAD binding domain-containing protein [Reyranellales bacterium]